MPTIGEARDSILGAFKTKWDADTPAVNGGNVPEVFYEGIGKTTPGPADAPWARVQVRHVDGDVTGVGSPTGSLRRTTKTGVVTVQIFTPLFDDDGSPRGLALAEDLAAVAKAAFEGEVTVEDVIFRRTRAVEVEADGPWFQWNVLSDFEYDEFVG